MRWTNAELVGPSFRPTLGSTSQRLGSARRARSVAQALIRRSYAEGIDLIAAVRLGDIEVDILARTVSIGGQRVDLSPLEHGLFWILASNAGAVVSKSRLEELLWGSTLGTSSNVVEQYVRRLRAKLGDDAKRSRFIETVRGEGYRFSRA